MTITTEYASFTSIKDLYRYMIEEDIKTINVKLDFWGIHQQMTIEQVKNWKDGKDLYGNNID